jgi:hypothetical protein
VHAAHWKFQVPVLARQHREIARPPDYLPVTSGGAARAAAMIAELL